VSLFNPSDFTIIWQLLYAAFLGVFVGVERGYRGRAAGMRTYALVCLGAALFSIISLHSFGEFSKEPGFTFDPSRIISNIVVGIGFLGAGLIIFQQGKGLQGLTTAAGLWVTAGIGVAVGVKMYFIAAFVSFLMIVIFYFLLRFEYLVGYKGGHSDEE
jgi:putative Mg2+ transporter-C (MgtC) family protein